MTDPVVDLWTMVFTGVTALGTVGVAGVAWRQLGEIKAQQRGWESLKAVERYDSDPELTKALRTMRTARKSGTFASDPISVSFEIRTVLNYLEGLAAGIEQNFYDENVLKAHMAPVFAVHIEEIFENELLLSKLDAEYPNEPNYKFSYKRLLGMNEKWTKAYIPWYCRSNR